MGDVVDNGPDKKQWTDELFKPCQELFGRVAVYPTIGNHEKNHAHYYKYFSMPTPEYYYSFKYNNAEFFVIDSNKSPKPGDEQYTWLEKQLAASTATWKFCYHHHPCYNSDADDYGNTWKGHTTNISPNTKPLIALYEKYNVDMALNGHIHFYERTWPIRGGKVDQKNGIVYLTSGCGGGKLETTEPTPAFFKNQGRVDFHFCYFTIHEKTLECHVFDHEGRLFDRFSIRKD
jgi:acid phosphatase type 7